MGISVEQDHGEAIAELRSKIEDINTSMEGMARGLAEGVLNRRAEDVKALNEWIETIKHNSQAILELQQQLSNLCEELVIIRLPKRKPGKPRLARWIFPED